jgi:hypothetical protein
VVLSFVSGSAPCSLCWPPLLFNFFISCDLLSRDLILLLLLMSGIHPNPGPYTTIPNFDQTPTPNQHSSSQFNNLSSQSSQPSTNHSALSSSRVSLPTISQPSTSRIRCAVRAASQPFASQPVPLPCRASPPSASQPVPLPNNNTSCIRRAIQAASQPSAILPVPPNRASQFPSSQSVRSPSQVNQPSSSQLASTPS